MLLPLHPLDISLEPVVVWWGGGVHLCYPTLLAVLVVTPTKERDAANDSPAFAELVGVAVLCGLCGQSDTSPLFI